MLCNKLTYVHQMPKIRSDPEPNRNPNPNWKQLQASFPVRGWAVSRSTLGPSLTVLAQTVFELYRVCWKRDVCLDTLCVPAGILDPIPAECGSMLYTYTNNTELIPRGFSIVCYLPMSEADAALQETICYDLIQDLPRYFNATSVLWPLVNHFSLTYCMSVTLVVDQPLPLILPAICCLSGLLSRTSDPALFLLSFVSSAHLKVS